MLDSTYKETINLKIGDRIKAFYKWLSNDNKFIIRTSDTYGEKQSWVSYESFCGKIKIGNKDNYPELIHHKDKNSLNDSPTNLEKMTNSQHCSYHRPTDSCTDESRLKISQKCKLNFEDENFRKIHSEKTKLGMWSKEGRNNYLIGQSKRRSYKGENNPAYKGVDKWLKENTKEKHFCLCGCGKEIKIEKYHHWAGIPKFVRGHRYELIKNHKVIKIEEIGIKKVYDIDMGSSIANFSANGIFVHNCSSGIEPIFDVDFERHLTVGIVKETRDIYKSKSVRIAHDISPHWHLKIQAKWQEWVDGSISKTINTPYRISVEDVKKIYMDAWKMGCKGITVFRDGSKKGVLKRRKVISIPKVKCSDDECHL